VPKKLGKKYLQKKQLKLKNSCVKLAPYKLRIPAPLIKVLFFACGGRAVKKEIFVASLKKNNVYNAINTYLRQNLYIKYYHYITIKTVFDS
jgi:hypothetical protein